MQAAGPGAGADCARGLASIGRRQSFSLALLSKHVYFR
jgi:hypothetical protein